MKKRTIKMAVAAFALTAVLIFAPAIAGCRGTDGRDGINGKDLTIYDIWQETKVQTGNPNLSYEDFLKEYLSYSSDKLEQATSLQSSINRSLMSGVSIITDFSDGSYYGSGVILDVNRQSGDMTIVTNCHVVYSALSRFSNSYVLSTMSGFARRVRLWLYGSEFNSDYTINAEIVGASKSYDIAVLKVSGSEIVKNSQAVAAQWISGEECFVGETVYAVGNADGKKLAASVGYISKDSEEVTVDMGTKSNSESFDYRVLRTDTAINGGNSGGGLFNKYGELVGIVNAKTVSENIDNMGYALPAATTKRVVQRIISDNSNNYGIETVSTGFDCEVSQCYTTGLNSDGVAEIRERVTVTKVVPFSKLWLKMEVGDAITKVVVRRGNTLVENMQINRLHNLTDALISVKANDEVIFTVERGEQTMEIAVSYSSSDYVNKDRDPVYIV